MNLSHICIFLTIGTHTELKPSGKLSVTTLAILRCTIRGRSSTLDHFTSFKYAMCLSTVYLLIAGSSLVNTEERYLLRRAGASMSILV